MLTISVPAIELFDQKNQKFIPIPSTTLDLEHSLDSLSKWESLWNKPFLSEENKTDQEAISYVRLMTLTPNVPPEVYARLSDENLEEINEYIGAKQTATTFSEQKTSNDRPQVVTAEIIYHWMIAFEIPFECQY